MMRALLIVLVPLGLSDYTDAPTAVPTATIAPTRTLTYAPTRITEFPSYAPTTDTYAPTTDTYAPTTDTYAPSFSSCPSLKDPDACPADADGLPLCNQQGLRTGDLCVTGASICPGSGSTNCPAFQVARRLTKVHGPVTRSFHGPESTVDEENRRRLAAPAECAGGECYVAQVGVAEESAGPSIAPAAAPTVEPTQPTAAPTGEPTAAPTFAPTAVPTAVPPPVFAPLTDRTIRTALAKWLSDSAAAEATYGHISTWETGGVTDMSYLFCASSGTPWAGLGCNKAAASFNEDIGAWDTSGVTTMYRMFHYAAAFDQDIGGWRVGAVADMEYMFSGASAFDQDIGAWDTSGVRSMYSMFEGASAFDQDLGWCVDDDVDLEYAFEDTRCESTSCGIAGVDCDISRTGNIMVNWKIKQAVAAWLSDRAVAEATYGHISTWDTSGVTNMRGLFDVDQNSGAKFFNEDISAWDTSGVTTMYGMFYEASAFNQDIGGWAVHNVRNMEAMFLGASVFNQDIGGWTVDGVTKMPLMFAQASSFNQDIGGWAVHSVKNMLGIFNKASAFDQNLGWCVADGVSLEYAFYNTTCAPTRCGVTQGSCP